MASGLSKVKTMGAVAFAYSFFLKNILFVLKLIVPFVFIALLLEMFIKVDPVYGGTDIIFYIKHFMIDLALGWMLFAISRKVILGEESAKLAWKEIFESKRMNAMVYAVLAFALCQGVCLYAEKSATMVLATEGFNNGTIIRILLFWYVAALMYILSFVAIPVAAQANVMSYLYVACRPTYMWVVLSLWSLTVLPVLLIYYVVVFFVSLGGKIDLLTLTTLMNNASFGDKVIVQTVNGIGFILLFAGLAYAMSFFLVLRTKPSKVIEEMKSKIPQKPVA